MLDDNPFSFQLQKFHYSAVAFVVLLYVWNLDKEVPKINTQKLSIEQFFKKNQREFALSDLNIYVVHMHHFHVGLFNSRIAKLDAKLPG